MSRAEFPFPKLAGKIFQIFNRLDSANFNFTKKNHCIALFLISRKMLRLRVDAHTLSFLTVISLKNFGIIYCLLQSLHAFLVFYSGISIF